MFMQCINGKLKHRKSCSISLSLSIQSRAASDMVYVDAIMIWVPINLTDEQNMNAFELCAWFLLRFHLMIEMFARNLLHNIEYLRRFIRFSVLDRTFFAVLQLYYPNKIQSWKHLFEIIQVDFMLWLKGVIKI